MSYRATAARFGIPPSWVTWCRLWLEARSVAARAQGADTRSARVHAAGAASLTTVAAAPDIRIWPGAADLY
jgi:hypothetical protein